MIHELAKLLRGNRHPSLGPERREGVKSAAELKAAMETMFEADQIDSSRREPVRALILLWHDHLDESHSISQNIHTADGSFIHGMMHRREPDYGNAKYWFQRVGAHAIFPALQCAASQLSPPGELVSFCRNKSWDPFAFIDACEAARGKSHDAEKILETLQLMETTLLFNHLLEAKL